MSRATVEIVYIDSINVGGFEMYAHICHPTFEAIRQKLNSGLY